jgi:16S rRNA (uracil1498-N3)-methyltransferase
VKHPEHEFALYFQDLSSQSHNNHFILRDISIVQRITSVLRLKQADMLILFDQQNHTRVVIEEILKKEVRVKVVDTHANRQLKPSITLLLPLLKKDALESAISVCVELGVTDIQLVTTQKTNNVWTGKKEKVRIERVMIAAAEQSKQFVLPQLHEPKPLSQILGELTSRKIPTIFFDPRGDSLLEVMRKIAEQKPDKMVCMVGPEGDLTDQEKDELKKVNVQFVRLTPTVLRSWHALLVGVGALRSL